MPKFTLICDHSCDLDTHVVRHEFNAENIYEVIEQFEFFLKGASYFPPGRLDFVNDECCGAGTNCEMGGAGNKHSQHYFDLERNR